MFKADLRNLCGTEVGSDAAVLAIVMDGHGAYESVTVFVPYSKARESATQYDSVFGAVDIAYSFRATYKMLDRKRSGFYTGIPMKNETFIVTTRTKAIEMAKEIYNKKKRKTHTVWRPNRSDLRRAREQGHERFLPAKYQKKAKPVEQEKVIPAESSPQARKGLRSWLRSLVCKTLVGQ